MYGLQAVTPNSPFSVGFIGVPMAIHPTEARTLVVEVIIRTIICAHGEGPFQ